MAKNTRADQISDANASDEVVVERVQTGIRIEKRMLKVLKAMAEYQDKTLSELMEDIVLHAFEGHGASAFGEKSLEKIAQLKKIYEMDYDSHASYRFTDDTPAGEDK